MTRLRLGLLGPMQVIVNGQPIVTFPYEKVKALFAYLAAESNYPHHRDTLAAMLWPDQGESKARSNLRKALSNLRHLLGDEADSQLFLTTRNTIQFNPTGEHTLDVAILTQLLDRHHQHSHSADEFCPECVANLERAVSLYRGPFLHKVQLLDSEAFETWIMLTRQHLHQLVLNACTKLITYYEHQYDYQKAQQYMQRQLQLEPWNETAHQQLIQLLVKQGQRTAALRQYDRCCKILEQELATEPEPTTIALGEAIRSGHFSHSTQANTGAGALKQPSKPVVSTLPAQKVTLVKNSLFPASVTSLVGHKQEIVWVSCFKRLTCS